MPEIIPTLIMQEMQDAAVMLEAMEIPVAL
jgi:hypothetical protein